jgi:hypothetical protein
VHAIPVFISEPGYFYLQPLLKNFFPWAFQVVSAMVIGLFVHGAAAPIFWISVYLTGGCYGEFHPLFLKWLLEQCASEVI